MKFQKAAPEQHTRPAQLSLTVILHLLAYASFLLNASHMPNRAHLEEQLPFLCGLSLSLSFFCAFQSAVSVRTATLVVRLLVISVIAYGLGDSVGAQLFLMISLISDAMFALTLGGVIGISAVSIPIAVAIRQPVSAWNTMNVGVTASDKLLLIGVLGLCTLFAVFLKQSWSREKEQRRKLSRLSASVKSLTEANQGFQQYAVIAQEQAAESERNRITREVHDAVGYAMTNILMMARVGKRLILREPEKVGELFDHIFGQAQEGLNEMRAALRMLRAKNGIPVHGMSALHRLIRTFESSTRVRVRVDYANVTWEGGGELDRLIFRFVQEGMTNAFRHGHATLINISFWREAETLHLRISDNGSGSTSSGEGIGLTGMQERIEEMGGTLEARSARHGFSVTARLPVASTARELAGTTGPAR